MTKIKDSVPVGRLFKILSTVLALALLTGCSTGVLQAGSAARVGTEVIKQQVVTDQVNELKIQIDAMQQLQNRPTAGQLGQLVVNRIIVGSLIDRSVAKLEIKVSDSEVSRLRDSIFAQYGRDVVLQQLASAQGVPESEVDSFFKLVLSQNYIGTTIKPKGSQKQQSAAAANYLMNAANESNIVVSPRYGTWDPNQMTAVGTDNSLSYQLNPVQ